MVLYEELMLALCFLPGAKSIEVDVFVPQVKLMADHWTSKKLPENYLGGVGFISIPMRKVSEILIQAYALQNDLIAFSIYVLLVSLVPFTYFVMFKCKNFFH